jgi:hypothetical protein
MDQPESRSRQRIRRDGWSPQRQIRFLETDAETRSVVKAAASLWFGTDGRMSVRRIERDVCDFQA